MSALAVATQDGREKQWRIATGLFQVNGLVALYCQPMSRPSDSLNPEPEPALAVSRFLAHFPGTSRAEAVHLTLKALLARVEPDRVLMCELAWEVHTHGYWRLVRRDDGSAYETEEAYLREVLGLASWRTAYKRLAVGRMLSLFSEPMRGTIRAAIADVGVAKATIIAPAIEHTGEWRVWTELAQTMPTPQLQARISAALEALPRGREPSPPGERFRRAILSAMPDIEAMELVERFFEVGTKVVGTLHPIAIFLAGCRECLAEWEVQAAGWRGRSLSRQPDRSELRSGRSLQEKGEGEGANRAEPAVCPSGQLCPQGQTRGDEP